MRTISFTALIAIICATTVWCRQAPDRTGLLPTDTSVTIGTLSNGLKYYIRKNAKPERRAELRLVVNAGSILENDDQRGLAHMCEHMAFNGTLHFRKNELVNYLESIGMRFGPDVNAYTSFDETVYMLQIPTDTPEILEKSFEILEDWSHVVSFDDDEIDRERGVVIEEWRLGRGAAARMRDKQFPVLFHDSHYAERLPIGDKNILDSFRHETLRQFYRSWYRPDLMAVIAVGDFDKSAIERLIHEHFEGLEPLRNEKPREYYPVPDHRAPLYAIATDSEATLTSASVYWKHEVPPQGTEGEYRRELVENLYNAMLNQRLSELTKKPNPPFLFASSSEGNLVRTKSAYLLQVGTRNNGLLDGMRAVLREAYRVRAFGFTPAELERQKKETLRFIEEAYAERDKTESDNFADEYIRNFLSHEPIPGIGVENSLYHRYLPGITLEEINRLGQVWMTDSNRVVVVGAPSKEGVSVPTVAELAAIFDSAATEHLQPYVEENAARPLLAALPEPGSVTSEDHIENLGVTVWHLSNGVRVVLKPTDFKNDEILFTSFSPGGTSLAPDSDYIPAMTAASVVDEGGIGDIDEITLEKMLAGKIVSVSPYISELDEGVGGSAAPQDLETMFQLVYLYFNAPRSDSSAFEAYRARIHAYLQNRSARPESALDDTLQVTMAQYHPRRRPWTEELFNRLDLNKSFQFYRSRFADAGSSTFIFVGSFSIDTLKPLVERYLASLPATHASEHWRDIGVMPPRGVIQKIIRRGIEPKSQVRMMFSGPFEWSQENRYYFNALSDVMTIKLREQLREEKGGTYGVSVGGTMIHDPRTEYRLGVSFGCAPERVEELVTAALAQIDSVQRFGVTGVYIEKVRETEKREHETRLKQNRFWLSNLQFYYEYNDDPGKILRYPKLVEGLNSAGIQEAAKKYFDMKNLVKVVLMPAGH